VQESKYVPKLIAKKIVADNEKWCPFLKV
jgi:hypothetical protein